MDAFSALARKIEPYLDRRLDVGRLLAAVAGRPVSLDARRELDFASGNRNRAFLIDQGWAYTYKMLPNGSRQVMDVGIPGDVVGARSLLSRTCDYGGTVLTRAVLYEVTAQTLETIYRTAPRLGGAILWSVSRDQNLLSERLVNIGRRSALERVAHFILELEHRLASVGLSAEGTFACPLSQTLLADALGLTPIHLNRVMRELRQQQMISYGDGSIQILKREHMIKLSGFDPRYLDCAKIPVGA